MPRGLTDAASIIIMMIEWPDGSRDVINSGLQLNTSIEIEQSESGDVTIRQNGLEALSRQRAAGQPELSGS